MALLGDDTALAERWTNDKNYVYETHDKYQPYRLAHDLKRHGRAGLVAKSVDAAVLKTATSRYVGSNPTEATQ